jgi:hypothetical protein
MITSSKAVKENTMFNLTEKTLTFEEKVEKMAKAHWAEVQNARYEIAQSRSEKRLPFLYVLEQEMKAVEQTKKASAKGMKYGKGFIEFGKSYKSGSVAFTLSNPDRLSDKQKAVVMRFIRDLETVSFNEAAPWLDVIFMLNRGEITMAQFQTITKIDMSSLSTWDARHDHNL